MLQRTAFHVPILEWLFFKVFSMTLDFRYIVLLKVLTNDVRCSSSSANSAT